MTTPTTAPPAAPRTPRTPERRRIAVVGAGVAGLTAAWELRRAGAAVELFEADGRLGGHAHTQRVPAPDGRRLALDTASLIHDERTSPHLARLLSDLGVPTRDADMSISVHCQGCGLAYAGADGPAGLLARPDPPLRHRYLRLLADIPRFRARARRLLATPGASDPTLRDFLLDECFSGYFLHHYLIPLAAAAPPRAPEPAGDHPARHLFALLDHHGLLTETGPPAWRTVTGGSAAYVRRIADRLTTVHRNTPVRAVHRHLDGVTLTTGDGRRAEADAVVIATHADQALELLADPTRAEREVLAAFRHTSTPTVLHRDASVLPRDHWARSAWNYRMPHCTAPAGTARISHHLNRLLRLDTAEDYLVTRNESPHDPVPEDLVISRTVHEHPVHTAESVAAQRLLPRLTTGRTAFAGAHHGWGSHEDGCRSGLAAARALLGLAADAP
ncbi:NAD(P)/FAD-dependent oxidoreductase [Kitasatospora sp. NPDC059577]|uniref:NAD(P)/FAD-dependent oxidoreductase n=1 Tax=Kitasatospora sp. NPDC059577 TaxID=3346873 RepID=UPI0036776217